MKPCSVAGSWHAADGLAWRSGAGWMESVTSIQLVADITPCLRLSPITLWPHHKASVGRRRGGAPARASNVIHKLYNTKLYINCTIHWKFAPPLICRTELNYCVGTGKNVFLLGHCVVTK